MIAFKSLSEVLKKTISWERKLLDFYDVAEVAMKRPESKRAVSLLREKLAEKLEVLGNVRPDQHGTDAWIRYLGDYEEADLLAVASITRDASPAEILAHLERYESMLGSFYNDVASRITTRSQKELFESLALFKSEQVEELRRAVKLIEER